MVLLGTKKLDEVDLYLLSSQKKLPCKLSGQALHAVELGLLHPIKGEKMQFKAELPKEFQKLLKVLKKIN